MPSNSYELKKIQNRIFKAANQYGSNLFHDEDWSNVHKMIDIIRNIEGVEEVNCGAGQYFNYISKSKPIDPAYRDYKLTIRTPFGILGGYLRCHAAGTMDDEFSKYDITVSVYPTKEETFEGKKIIISRSQLSEIMDNARTPVVFDGSNAAELGSNADAKYKDAVNAGFKPDSISLQGRSSTNNASDKDETVIGFDSSKGNIKDAVTSAANQAVQNGVRLDKVVLQGNPTDITNGTSESKCYTKKQVEECRLAEMRRNGTVMSKKELKESLQYDADMESFFQKMWDEGLDISYIKSQFESLQCSHIVNKYAKWILEKQLKDGCAMVRMTQYGPTFIGYMGKNTYLCVYVQKLDNGNYLWDNELASITDDEVFTWIENGIKNTNGDKIIRSSKAGQGIQNLIHSLSDEEFDKLFNEVGYYVEKEI